MPSDMAVQVTIYLNEADQWHHRPLHMEILNYLRQENVYAATALHTVAGFLGRQQVKTSHLVDAGGKLPVIVIFVDTDEHVSRVLPTLKEMAAHRLIGKCGAGTGESGLIPDHPRMRTATPATMPSMTTTVYVAPATFQEIVFPITDSEYTLMMPSVHRTTATYGRGAPFAMRM
jgi:PII-like signaling protein